MKVLVCGGRNYDQYNRVAHALGTLNRKYPIERIIHGGCRGADKLASDWAKRNGISESIYYARWEEEGKAAGPLRNQRMVDNEHPDAAIAFRGGRGTADMIKRLRDANIPVWEVE